MDCPELGGELRGLTVECNGWAPSGLAAHFDVPPRDSVIPARTDGFHRGFFSGKARGIALDAVGLGIAVADLTLGKDPAQKAVAEASDRRFDAWHFRDIDAAADNHSETLTLANNLAANS